MPLKQPNHSNTDIQEIKLHHLYKALTCFSMAWYQAENKVVIGIITLSPRLPSDQWWNYFATKADKQICK